MILFIFDPYIRTMLQSSLITSICTERFEKRNDEINCSNVAGPGATKVSHGALPFRHDDRCAHLAVLLRLDATLRRDPGLHVLGEQRGSGARPGDDTEACVEHRRAHRHRH